MIQFNLKSLGFTFFTAGCLLAFCTLRNQPTFLANSILLPCTLGLYFRYARSKSMAFSILAVACSAICFGALMSGYGSHYRTFIEPTKGILVGQGWGSVFLATFAGAVIGAAFGLVAILLFLVVVGAAEHSARVFSSEHRPSKRRTAKALSAGDQEPTADSKIEARLKDCETGHSISE